MKQSGDATLVAVCSATGSHASHAAKKFGFRSLHHRRVANYPESFHQYRRHRDSPSPARAAGAGRRSREGKHVFCEKPLCLTESELRSIVRDYLGIDHLPRPVLMVGFNRRFAPMTRQIKEFLAPIAEPLALHYRVNAGFLPPDHWVNDREQGGGRILGEVCHFVDLLMFLAASPIVEVEGRALAASPRYSGDNVLVSFALRQRIARNNQLSRQRGPCFFQGALRSFRRRRRCCARRFSPSRIGACRERNKTSTLAGVRTKAIAASGPPSPVRCYKTTRHLFRSKILFVPLWPRCASRNRSLLDSDSPSKPQPSWQRRSRYPA